MIQPLIGGGNSCSAIKNLTRYCGIQGATAQSSTEANVNQVVPTGGTVSELRVELASAPDVADSGKGYTITMRLNGADTAITCQVLSDATTASDLVHTVDVVAGDKVDFKVVPTVSNPANTVKFRSAMKFTGTTANESIYMSCTNDTPSTTDIKYRSPMWNSQGANTWSSNDYGNMIPLAATIKKFYVLLTAAPGAGKNYAFTLTHNSGTTTGVTVTITGGTAKTGSDTANTHALTAGETLDLKCEPYNTPASTQVAWSFVLVADVDGESAILSAYNSNLSTSSTEYLEAQNGSGSSGSTEAPYQQISPAFTLKNLYVKLGTAPGVGYSRTITMMVEGGASTLTVTITGAATTGNDTAHEVSVSDGNTLSTRFERAGNYPDPSIVAWGAVCYIAPPAPPGGAPARQRAFAVMVN